MNTVPFRKVRKILEKNGYSLNKINGSHHVFRKPYEKHISIPVHSGIVKGFYWKKALRTIQNEKT